MFPMKGKNNRWILTVATATAFLLVTLAASAEDQKAVKDPIALVNGVKIAAKQYQRELNYYLDQASQQGRKVSDDMLPKIRTDVLNNLIDREVLFQESQKEGIDIKPQAVDQQMEAIKQKFPNQAEFEKAITKMDLSESDVKSQIKQDLAIRELIDKQVVQKIVVSDDEAKAFYDANPNLFKQPEEVKASHILIKVDSDASEAQKAEARKEIEKIQQKLKAGGDFAALAKEFSQGPSSVNGGELGYFKRGQMVKPFEEAAFALKPNEVSDIVETQFGYHLIKVLDKKPEKTFTYAEIKDQLSRNLKQQKVQKEAGVYIDKLINEAKIEKYL
jgi:peptidyl-prolyl cis-trans isomerase C